jgi:hypothetical protein
LWNCTFVGHPFDIYDDVDGQSFPTHVSNFDVRGCMFHSLKVSTPLGHVDFSSFADNHFEETSGPQVQTPGVDVTTGISGLDSYGRPTSSSPLTNRFGPPVVPSDADGKARGSTSDVGAYER